LTCDGKRRGSLKHKLEQMSPLRVVNYFLDAAVLVALLLLGFNQSLVHKVELLAPQNEEVLGLAQRDYADVVGHVADNLADRLRDSSGKHSDQ
jgi:hypothetical protein